MKRSFYYTFNSNLFYEYVCLNTAFKKIVELKKIKIKMFMLNIDNFASINT